VQLTLVTGASPSLTSLVAWAEFALCLALPIFFSGIVVSLAVTPHGGPCRDATQFGATRQPLRAGIEADAFTIVGAKTPYEVSG
jgi:hypothetical protein